MNKIEILEKLHQEWEGLRYDLNAISLGFCLDFRNCLCDTDYLCDLISEYADSHIDEDCDDLLEWVKYNYRYLEYSVSSFKSPDQFDLWQCIQDGQYYKYNEELNCDERNIIKGLALLYLINELKEIDAIERTEQEFEELFDGLNALDTNNRLYEIKEICDVFLKVM